MFSSTCPCSRLLAFIIVLFTLLFFIPTTPRTPFDQDLPATESLVKHLSIVVPAYHEKVNIRPLTVQVFSSVKDAGIQAELIIVDDNSDDGTVEEVNKLRKEGYKISIIVRTKERGLSTAVLAGFEKATSEVVLVMDADLQHPAKYIPDLVGPIFNNQAHFTLGSRYTAGGAIEQWSITRKIISQGATLLAQPLVSVNDPMSGFFAVRKSLLKTAEDLNPLGFKIALELMVKCSPHRMLEVPFTFIPRAQGESKLQLKTQVLYLSQLATLYWFCYARYLVAIAVVAIVVAYTIVKPRSANKAKKN